MVIKNILIIFLLIFQIREIVNQNCGPKFNGKCSCGIVNYIGEPKYIVNCTNTNFQNTSVLEYLPNNIEVLIFTGNYIPELPWNVLGSLNDYTMLKIIDMSNNHIREIRGKSYHHVQNVERLILNHNNLSISRSNDDDVNHHHRRVFSNFINLMELHLTNAFSDNTTAQLSQDLHDIFVNSNLTKLMKLHLEQNEISKFYDRDVFCDLPNLKDLHLGDNLLKELNFNVLCLKKLRFLDLQRNAFQYVKLKDLNLMNELESYPQRNVNLIVDFLNNPFQCDCTISNFIQWLKTTKIIVRRKENLTCRRYNDTVYSEDLLSLHISKCNVLTQAAKSTTGHTITLVFLLLILCCILIALMGALIYVSKDRIKYFVSPVMNSIGKKVQYTTIKDEECQEVYV